MGKRIIENKWFHITVNSKGKLVILFSGEPYSSKILIELLKDYVQKPNINKVHLIFDATYVNHEDKSLFSIKRVNTFIHVLRIIYTFNPNVRIIIHAHSGLRHIIDGIYYKKRDIQYTPRIVYDIDYDRPLYFGIGYDNYIKIVSKGTKFEMSYVDSNYIKEGK